MANKHYKKVIRQIEEIHDKKAADYASTANPYSNFEEAADIAGVTVDQVFRVLIGVKLARLRELLGDDRAPQNESVDDSLLDLTNYCALWTSYRRQERECAELMADARKDEELFGPDEHGYFIAPGECGL